MKCFMQWINDLPSERRKGCLPERQSRQRARGLASLGRFPGTVQDVTAAWLFGATSCRNSHLVENSCSVPKAIAVVVDAPPSLGQDLPEVNWLRQLSGKESACNAGDMGSVPGLGRSPGEGNGKPTPVFLSGRSYGERSLVGYSPWGRKELDTAERLHKLHG